MKPSPSTTYATKWAKYYADRLNPRYDWHVRTKYAYMINRIRQAIADSPRGYIHEAGCGIGSITKQILTGKWMPGYYQVSDINREMIQLAQENLTGRNVGDYKLADIRHPYYVPNKVHTITHSHGVLEHFNNSDIRQIIASQKEHSDLIFHYVPSDKYTSKSFGDERLMSGTQWYEICRPDKIEEFNNGYDLLLVWHSLRGRK